MESLQKDSRKETFNLFESLLQGIEASEWSFFRKLAWGLFKEKGLPHKKMEAFQYVSFRKLYEALGSNDTKKEVGSEKECKPFILEESQKSLLLFEDGELRLERSHLPAGIIVLPLDQALTSSYSPFLKHHIKELIEKEKDPWALLNAALSEKGVFIYVPPKTRMEVPMQILHLQKDHSRPYIGPRVHLFLGAGAEVKVVSSYRMKEGTAALYNELFDVSLEERALFSHDYYAEGVMPAWGFSSFRAALKKNSQLKSNCIMFGSDGFRRDYSVVLAGERAEAELRGLTALEGSLESHVHVHMEHRAPLCRSYQFFKNILASKSRSSFSGQIHVKQLAQQTDAYQMNQNLLLSDDAIANTKPSLEIFADDVKASHGATVFQLDENQMLYLRTRGVPLSQAKSLLTTGFCQEILDEISYPSLRRFLMGLSKTLFLTQG